MNSRGYQGQGGFTPALHRRELGFLNERTTRDKIIGSVDFIQRLKIDAKLDVHRGCVNTICWNDTGTKILSGSDDKKLCITNPMTRKVLTSIQSGHRSNIFSARFLPGCRDNQVISCSGDGIIAYNDVEREDLHGSSIFNCHYGTAYEVTTVPNDPYTFLSCGEDYTVRWFDLRVKTTCMKDDCKEDILINCHRAVTSLAVNPVVPYHLGVGCSDSSVRVFDRRMLGTRATGNYMGRGIQGMFARFCPSHLQNKYSRPTSLHYSADGQDILVSYSTDYVYLFSPNRCEKEERVFSTDIDPEDLRSPADKDEMPPVNPVKKLRLRGDWSDTGPKARPRSEQADESERPRMTIIQRMSEMLTRWLEDTAHARRPTPANRTGESSEASARGANAPSTSEDQETFPAGSEEATRAMILDEASSRAEAISRESTREQVESEDSSGEKYVSAASEVEPEKSGSDTEACRKGVKSKKAAAKKPDRKQLSTSSSSSDTQFTTTVKKVSTKKQSSTSSSSDTDNEGLESKTGIDRKLKQSAKKDSRSKSSETSSTTTTESDNVHVQYDEKTKCVDKMESRSSSSSDGANPDDKLLSSIADGDEVSSAEGKKRKRSVHSSPSGSLTDDTASKQMSSCQATGETKVDKHVVKSLKVKEGGKDPDSSHSSGDDEGDDDKNIKPKLDNDSKEATSSIEGSVSNVQSDKRDTGHDTEEITEETEQMSIKTKHPQSESVDSRDSSRDRESDRQGGSEEAAPVFALSERAEDSNPQRRRTSQFAAPTQRVRKMSVSGPPVVAPNEGFNPQDDIAENRASTSQEDDRESRTSQEQVGREELSKGQEDTRQDRPSTSRDVVAEDKPSTSQAGVGASASGGEEAASRDRGVRPAAAAASSRSDGETRPLDQDESPNMTQSESDTDDDDAILSPPRGSRRRRRERRQRGMSSEESRERASPLNNVSAENRLRELLRARTLRKAREKEEQQMESVYAPRIKKVYKGHRNSRTMIKEANFWGDNFVLSGSDCGHVFIWDRRTSELVMLLEGDRHVVNCVQPHPFDPVLATSGIDYDIKLWAPLAEFPHYPDDAEEVMRINELMLEETRDTITVPPSFMLRMLASINHLNAERRRRESHSSSDEES